MRERRAPQWGRWITSLLIALAVVWLAWAGRGIWVPVACALILAALLDPTVDRLENRGLPRGPASALVFFLVLGVGLLAVVMLSPGISEQAGAMARDLGRLFPDPERPNLVPLAHTLLAKLDANPALRDALLDMARAGTARLSQSLVRTSELLLIWAPNLIWLLVVPVLAFYALIDFHRIYAKGLLLIPRRHRPLAQTLIAEITALIGKYLRGLGILCFLLGCSIAAVLAAFGSPYWQLAGFFGGLLYAVPVAGPLFTVGVVALVTMITADAGRALAVGASLLLLIHGLFDQVITPRVLGRQVGLHPILIILALLLGFQVWGIGGMLVAVPLAASIQAVVLHLVPRLSADLGLRPLEELQRTEDETRSAHLREEERPLDDHFCLHSVVENVE